MADDTIQASRSLLDPWDRAGEIVFGLIMVLTFTGSLSVAQADRADVRTMLLGAIGCNLAWGIVDAVMYLLGTLTQRSRTLRAVRAVRSSDADAADRMIRAALPEVLDATMGPAEIAAVRRRLGEMPDPGTRWLLRPADLAGAAAVFGLVFLSTFPVVIPFLAFRNAAVGLRASNAVAVAMLFLTGYVLGQHTAGRPWLFGLVAVLVGAALVAITIALGG